MHCQHHTQWAKTISIPLKIRRQGCWLSPPLFNTVVEALATVIRQEEEIKDTQIGRKK